jgi:folylpolyglutamate synthase
VNPANELNVCLVVDDVAKEIGAGPGLNVGEELRLIESDWKKATRGLHLFQRENAALACLAVREAIGSIGRPTLGLTRQLLPGLKGAEFPGRYQRLSVPAVFGDSVRNVLTDGAHNDDAARTLREYVDSDFRYKTIKDGDLIRKAPRDGWPVTWVMAMSEGKDPRKVLKELLQPRDNLIATTFGPVDGMPWVKSMDPNRILEAADEVMPSVVGIAITERSPHRALMAAKYLAPNHYGPIVLTGSLYLMGDFWRERRALQKGASTLNVELMDKQEKHRVSRLLSLKLGSGLVRVELEKEMKRIEEEIEGMGVDVGDTATLNSSATPSEEEPSEVEPSKEEANKDEEKPAFRIRKHYTTAQNPDRYAKTTGDASPWDTVLNGSPSTT